MDKICFTYLPRSTTEHLSEPFGTFNEPFRAQDDATHRCSKAFCETDANAVKAGAVFFQTDSFCGHGVEETCSIQVHCDWLLAFRDGEIANEIGNLFCVLQGEDRSAECILKGDDASRREMDC